jgi:hypothetical protein
MGTSASVSFVTEDDEVEDNAYVNVARAERKEEEDDRWQDLDNSWLEMEAEEGIDDGFFYVNALTGREGQEEDEDGVYYVDVSPRKGSEPEE